MTFTDQAACLDTDEYFWVWVGIGYLIACIVVFNVLLVWAHVALGSAPCFQNCVLGGTLHPYHCMHRNLPACPLGQLCRPVGLSTSARSFPFESAVQADLIMASMTCKAPCWWNDRFVP